MISAIKKFVEWYGGTELYSSFFYKLPPPFNNIYFETLLIIIIVLYIVILFKRKFSDYIFKKKIQSKQRKQRKQQDAYVDELLESLKKDEVTIDQIIAQKATLLRSAIHDEILNSLLQEVQTTSCKHRNTLPEENSEIFISENTYLVEEDDCDSFSETENNVIYSSEDKSEALIEESVEQFIEETPELSNSTSEITYSMPPKLAETVDETPEEVEDEKEIINIADILATKTTPVTDNKSMPEESRPQTNEFNSIIEEIRKKNAAKEQARIITEQAETIRKQNIEVLERKIQQEFSTEKHPKKENIQQKDAFNKELEKRRKDALKIAERERAKREKNKQTK